MDTTTADSTNDLDDLFDYDVGLDEILQGTNNTTTNANEAPRPAGDPSSLGLGLDEEVKITKKRQPVAKLDESRLLSQAGIPKLRSSAKTKLRLKGKGHEFSDAARLLNFYQLWLDDLFPRAKFADGLEIIEKLGHTKRIQTMRKEWIDEEKREAFGKLDNSHRTSTTKDLPTRMSSDQNNAGTENADDSNISPPVPGPSESTEHDLFMPNAEGPAQPTASHPEPDDDDLEDLLGEQDDAMQDTSNSAAAVPEAIPDDFDDEYEAMNDMGL
ncbi:hypothetical protein N7456_005440 [Penicillium angulare]|uniref:Chromosome segregation in meiosis protein n=1 Tax=Penicillium angulare TaxID=116970 RepID=A0A9W9KJK9_9EURO|nr:hypothetical protein N7456_005440 [Penicillium angulare]